MSQNLFQIEQDALALEQLFFESGGELNESLELWLSEVQNNLSTKADSYKSVIDRMEHTQVRLKTTGNEYLAAAKQVENVRDRLRDRIKESMTLLGVTEIKGPNNTFKLVNGAKKLVIHNETDLHSKYRVIQEVVSLDKEQIKIDLALGAEVKGAELVPTIQLRTSITKGK